jgi:hypothetical protein
MNDTNGSRQFSGWYEGTVAENVDPERQNRLQVRVPDVLGDDGCIWARSAVPPGAYSVPPKDATVWVGFEQGDPDSAIWAGCWPGATSDLPSQVTSAPPGKPPIVLQSQAQNTITLSSAPGECMTLETSKGASGPRIVITTTSITLSTGQGASIELSGAGVKINGNALTVDA